MGKKNIITYCIILFIKLVFFQLINYINSTCSGNSPFIKNNECVSFCSTDELKLNCKFADLNTKLKQITNLIELGKKNYRLININSNFNNDIIIQVSEYSNYGEKFFYGLKNNGRYLFKDENQQEYPITTFNIEGEEDSYLKKFGGESSFIKISNEEEFFINIETDDQNTIAFTFDNIDYNSISTDDFLEHNFYSDRGTFSFLSQDTSGKYYYLIAGVYKDNDKYNCYMKKAYFTSNVLSTGSHLENLNNIECSENKMISCFKTALDKIICFFRGIDNNSLNDYYYISIYESSIKKGTIRMEKSESPNLFYKAIHLKEEIGVFAYYSSESDHYPKISFNFFDSENLANIEVYNSYTNIVLNNRELRYDYMLNDIIKISDTAICYGSVDFYKCGIYLVILQLYNNDTKMNIKYYIISIKDIFHFLVYRELKLSLYNNEHIVFASSICYTDNCNYDTDEHYSSFLIFNYPNSTDIEIDLFQKIGQTNEDIDKIVFDLEQYTLIENNVFGYVIKGIKIIDFPGNMELKSFKTNSTVNKNDILEHNDNFTISFSSIEKKNYIIKYALVATEDEFYKSRESIVHLNKSFGGDDEIDFFGGGTYVGRTSHLTIIIDKEFTTNCNNDCFTCLSTNPNYCVVRQSNNHHQDHQDSEKTNEGQTSKTESSLLKTKTSIISEHSQTDTDILTQNQIIESDSTTQHYTSTHPIISTSSLTSSPSSSRLTTPPSQSLVHSQLMPSSQLMTTSPSSQLKTPSLSTQLKTPSPSTQLMTSFPSSQLKTPSPSSQLIISSPSSDIIHSFKSTTFSQLISSSPLVIHSSLLVNKEYECTNEQILENSCKEGKMTNEQIIDIYDNIKENIVKKFDNNNTIIETQNAAFQVSTVEQQKYNVRAISSVDLGECEELIKNSIPGFHKEDELIIFKTDIKYEEKCSTYVYYEVYNPYTLEPVNLSVCDKKEITIDVPVYLAQNVEEMKEKLDGYGYDIFDENDDFYNDICTKFTTDSGTDMNLNDRRNDIYGLVNNVSLCQKGCVFKSYNSTSKKSKCNCDIQEEKTIIEELTDIKDNFAKNKEIIEIFRNPLSLSNIKVLKCYQIFGDFKNIFNNYGCLIISALLIIYAVLMVKYFINGYITINNYIKNILDKKKFHSTTSKKHTKKRIKIKKKKSNKNIDDNISITKKKRRKKTKNIYKINAEIACPLKRRTCSYSQKNNDSSTNKKILKSNTYLTNSGSVIIKYSSPESSNKILKKIGTKNSVSIKPKKNKRESFMKTINIKKEPMTELELNLLKYEEAFKYDKRTYCQYYISLIKRKNIILFTFFQNNDYNILIIKISLFLVTISLYFVVNGFFFSDDSMHDVYVYKGKFIFVKHIAKILYTFVIVVVIRQTLNLLSLSEKNLLELKQEKKLKSAVEKSKSIQDCLKIKIIIFYILGIILMLFFWYFITCFCAIYSNTQIILIENTAFSFLASLFYLFTINLLPGIFRMYSLKSAKKDKECFYNTGIIIALF